MIGFSYIVTKRHDSLKEIRYAAVILVVGLIIYFLRSWRNREWPFAAPLPTLAEIRAS